jgi:3-isopropylmalate/(R)-2-methylmalate dehydratase large subunit
MVMSARTLFDKVWEQHEVTRREDGTALLYIDRHFLHEGSFHAFAALQMAQRTVRRPDATFACADHYVPTQNQRKGLEGIENAEIRNMVRLLHEHTDRFGIRRFGLQDPGQGIVHVVGPEQGLTQPGLTIVCGDSHTSTHGAFGALAFGIGASEVAHVLATQCLWQIRPKTLQILAEGQLSPGVTSKDLILYVIHRIGAAGAVGHSIEFAGSTIENLSMEARMTLCNMAIEAGGRAGMIAPDDKTFEYLKGRPFAPHGDAWDAAVSHWRSLSTDPGARFDRQARIDASDVAPMVTWGTSPEDAAPIDGTVPDPRSLEAPDRKARFERVLDYMGLEPNRPLEGLPVDRVFIGSCTNSRIEDLRVVAQIVDGHQARIPAWVVPGSLEVQRQAEAEGLHEVFMRANLEWRDPGCSMCLGINGDTIAPFERCASTSNRNFEGRQGKLGRTHLMSPAMAAVAAITGELGDIRKKA